MHPNTEAFGKLPHQVQLPLWEVNFSLDGGDSLVIDDKLWLISAGAVDLTMKGLGGVGGWSRAIEFIAQQAGRPPIVVGYALEDVENKLRWILARLRATARASLPQDIHEMKFLRRVAVRFRVGTWALCRTLIDIFTPDRLFYESDWGHIDLVLSVTGRTKDGKPLLYLADPTAKPCPDDEGADFQAPYLAGVKRVLEAKFAVERNPAPYVDDDMLSYNNTIVQRNPDVVWLPRSRTETTF